MTLCLRNQHPMIMSSLVSLSSMSFNHSCFWYPLIYTRASSSSVPTIANVIRCLAMPYGTILASYCNPWWFAIDQEAQDFSDFISTFHVRGLQKCNGRERSPFSSPFPLRQTNSQQWNLVGPQTIMMSSFSRLCSIAKHLNFYFDIFFDIFLDIFAIYMLYMLLRTTLDNGSIQPHDRVRWDNKR